ncbi:hypothetical protein DL95DRAFT_444775 [Leptodontidium sp. 2 PMI_412]|nr:hypothetical protein DL95DRAFT_444775 [Leptodontidium sp. 2 PMI_412]
MYKGQLPNQHIEKRKIILFDSMPRNGLDDCLSLGRGGQDAIPLKALRWWADNGDCRIMACSQEKRGGTTVPVLQPELGIENLFYCSGKSVCTDTSAPACIPETFLFDMQAQGRPSKLDNGSHKQASASAGTLTLPNEELKPDSCLRVAGFRNQEE